MKKILCPTDFSSVADNAVVYAAKLAHKFGGVLTLLHVRSLTAFTDSDEPATITDELTALLDQRCLEVSRVFKVSCDYEIATAYTSVTKTIGVEGKKYDLIVMGTNGASDLLQFFYGTNTYRVIRSALIPVLVVPENCLYTEIANIVFAFDYWRQLDLPLNPLAEFAKSFNSRITVLQVMEESVSERANQELYEFQEQAKKWFSDTPLTFETIHASDLTNSLHEYMMRSQADMLALSEINRPVIEKLFHKSVIKRVSALATYPVFVFE
ncbi:MAG: universal stress protein [Flammeovirgaceae bacterium]|nr:MAG: universal stress protein [Flammeovirgaceae bacterium]